MQRAWFPAPSGTTWLEVATFIARWQYVVGVPVLLLFVFAPLPTWLVVLIGVLFLPVAVGPLLIRTLVGFRQGYRGA